MLKPSLKKATNLQRRIDDGHLAWADLSQEEQLALRQVRKNTLRDAANKAILEYGHGSLHGKQSKTFQISGSAGGLVRVLSDDFQAPCSAGLRPILTVFRSVFGGPFPLCYPAGGGMGPPSIC